MSKKAKKSKNSGKSVDTVSNEQRASADGPPSSSSSGAEQKLQSLAREFAVQYAGGLMGEDDQWGRTGENRFTTPYSGSVYMPDGSRKALAMRYDDTSWDTLDKARFYPVLCDCIDTVVSAVSRAGCHFVSDNKMAEQLAAVLVRPHVRDVCENMTRGAVQFGYQVAEKVEQYFYNVKTSSGQADSGEPEYVFPFAVGFKKFLYFDPSDTILLLDNLTGDFGGLKQYVPTLPDKIDIPAHRLLHYVNRREFDSVYGFAQTKAAIPFVRLAEMLYDDMARWARLFGAPYKVGHFRPGFTPTGQLDSKGQPVRVDNRDIMLNILNALDAGSSAAWASEFDPSSNQPYWGVDLKEVNGEGAQHYVEMIKHCNDMIRTAFGIPAYATAESPDKGTFSLGKSMIDLFLRQVNARLEGLKVVIDTQLLPRWNELNFGSDAPPIVIEFEPPDLDPTMMLLTAVIQAATAGRPLIDADGNQVTPDYAFMFQRAGVPFRVSKPTLLTPDTSQQQQNSGDVTGGGGGGGPAH